MNRKTLGFFLSVLISIFCLGGTFGCLPAYAAHEDLLGSWNNTGTTGTGSKEAIIDFVNKVTNQSGDYYVPPKDRIAVFDNDGTLWAERPDYFQALFIEENREPVSTAKFTKILKTTKKKIDTNGDRNISDEIKSFLSDIAVFDGITTDSYISQAHDFVYNQKHPEYDAEYIQLTYKPVIGLVNYLKANGFKVYICSGGGVDFVRSFAEDAYGIPPEKVIGSAVKTKYDETEGPGGNLVRQPMLAQYNDQQGKPVGIERHIGKRPIIAVGNSGGDLEMFKYTNVGEDTSLIVLINHDDCDREYKYNDIPGGANGENESLDEAEGRDNWIVVSMKDDFQTIFESNPQRPTPNCPPQ